MARRFLRWPTDPSCAGIWREATQPTRAGISDVAGNRIVAIGFVPWLLKLLEDQLIRATVTNVGRGLNDAADNPGLQRLHLRRAKAARVHVLRRATERSIRAYGGDDSGAAQVVVSQFVIGDGHLHWGGFGAAGSIVTNPDQLAAVAAVIHTVCLRSRDRERQHGGGWLHSARDGSHCPNRLSIDVRALR
jgi:hypothetical protein